MILMPEKEWINHIDQLKKVKPTKKLEQAILDAIQPPKNKFGIAFSGGIDSSLIAYLCKKQKADFICYAVGIENSTDLIAARKAAKLMHVKLKYKEFSLEEAEKILKKVVKMIGTDVTKVGVGAVDYAVYLLAKEDKIKEIYSGLGSEEIFAGYERHTDVKDINKECWRGLKMMWDRDFTRDFVIAEKLKFKYLIPFLDDELIKTAMAIDGKKKINKNYKKVALRKLAEKMGLPKEIAWRKKQAAQYGSKFDRAILRLAKRNGFKYKKEYLQSLQ